MKLRLNELTTIVQGTQILVPVLWEEKQEEHITVFRQNVDADASLNGDPLNQITDPLNPIIDLALDGTELKTSVSTTTYYDCEVVLSNSLSYGDLKAAIHEQLEFNVKSEALGLLPKTIDILTKPKYDLSTWGGVKAYREQLLKESDWTQLPDAPANKEEWAEYRQKLRDLPQTFDDPNSVVFPAKPV
jgi:hypothetical protein